MALAQQGLDLLQGHIPGKVKGAVPHGRDQQFVDRLEGLALDQHAVDEAKVGQVVKVGPGLVAHGDAVLVPAKGDVKGLRQPQFGQHGLAVIDRRV